MNKTAMKNLGFPSGAGRVLRVLFFSLVGAALLLSGCAPSVKLAHPGDRYEGGMSNGKPNGRGTYYYADGGRYEENFYYGKRASNGVMNYKDGSKFVGKWNQDMPFEGTYNYANGDLYVGHFFFEAGEKNGQGTQYYANGAVYSGSWYKDKFNGEGTLRKTDGKVIHGMWVDGEYRGPPPKKIAKAPPDNQPVGTKPKSAPSGGGASQVPNSSMTGSWIWYWPDSHRGKRIVGGRFGQLPIYPGDDSLDASYAIEASLCLTYGNDSSYNFVAPKPQGPDGKPMAWPSQGWVVKNFKHVCSINPDGRRGVGDQRSAGPVKSIGGCTGEGATTVGISVDGSHVAFDCTTAGESLADSADRAIKKCERESGQKCVWYDWHGNSCTGGVRDQYNQHGYCAGVGKGR